MASKRWAGTVRFLACTRDVAGCPLDLKEAVMKARIARTITRTVLCASALLSAAAPGSAQAGSYRVTNLPTLGGTISRGNSVNDRGWVAGYSTLAGDQSRHAAVWFPGGLQSAPLDLGTLGGANSSVTWPVKSNTGLIAGIAQTATPDPLGEAWSCAAFFTGPAASGTTCLGFVWEGGALRALPTLGGNNGFATGANDLGQVVGWAENTVHDPTCVPPQVLQFRPVVWGPGKHQIRELPPLPGDTSGAATAINDRGQVVGISGACDQAVGRYTAKHAVLWENGRGTDLGNLGVQEWVTPMAINQRGDVVGFAGTPGEDPDNPNLRAFLWTRRGGLQNLGTLPGDVSSEAHGLNERGQVVGDSCNAAGACRAFVWQNGVMRDLNTLAASGYAGVLTTAQDINDRGVITGRASDPTTGTRPAFVANPLP
jgi:probable HAF family extracellular repeat protein